MRRERGLHWVERARSRPPTSGAGSGQARGPTSPSKRGPPPIVVESLDRFPIRFAAWLRDGAAGGLPTVSFFYAVPGHEEAYGAVSGPRSARHGGARGFHAVSREVFRPRPNVRVRRSSHSAATAEAIPPGVKRVVHGRRSPIAARRFSEPPSRSRPGLAFNASRPQPAPSNRSALDTGVRAEAADAPVTFVAPRRGSPG